MTGTKGLVARQCQRIGVNGLSMFRSGIGEIPVIKNEKWSRERQETFFSRYVVDVDIGEKWKREE
jgi:hypothetical protein